MGQFGPIRFVGGPWHNRIVPCEWHREIFVPIPRKFVVAIHKPDPFSQPEYEVARYLLTPIELNSLLFFEYHASEMNPRGALNSGDMDVAPGWAASLVVEKDFDVVRDYR